MLSIGKLNTSRAGYYLEQLPGGRDEYYTAGRDTTVGTWMGSAAARLDLADAVSPGAFRRVLDAEHPGTGASLGVPRTTGNRLAGFDLCFSAPKSVSVAWAFADRELAAVIASSHDRAVSQALGALEAEAVRARRGAGGQRLVATEGVVAAGFRHYTSRAGDPQLHTHVVVANMTPDRSGRWTAIDGAGVYRWAKTVGYLYQAALRRELSDRLGVEWGPVRNGAADLAGVDRRALDAFSKRAEQIAAAIGRRSDIPLRAAKTATVATRAAKASVPDLDTLRLRWQHEAADLGLRPAAIVDSATTEGAETTESPFDALVDGLLGPDGLTANRSSFDRRDVLRALAAAAPHGARAAKLRADADRVLAHPDVVPLDHDRPSEPRYSTRDLIAVETAVITAACAGRSAGLDVAHPDAVGHALAARPTLSPEQRAMVAQLVSSGAGVEVVVGRAGSGKTFALDAARAAWQASGFQVIGTALAARAAAELQSGAGIPATTIDQLLVDLARPGPLGGLAPRTVVVVDEAGMVGTRKLAALLDHARQRRAKVILVGDHRQLPEIAAGGAFAALARALPVIELVDNHRQHETWERDALAELRAGNVPRAIHAYLDAGRVTLASSAEDARQRLVDDWWNARQSGSTAGIFALRRAEVDDLNRRARQHLDDAGLLGAERLEVGGREFAVGDQVLCLRNDRRLGVRNGTLAAVADLDVDRGEIALTDGTRLPASYLTAGHLTYGYATTIHKAQGATVDRAFLLGSDALYRESGYVGLSRARDRTDLYLVALTPADALDVDPVAETIRRLSQSHAQTMATDQLPPSLQPINGERAAAVLHAEHAALVADPAPWLTDAIGPPPLAGRDRAAWALAAGRLTAYRAQHPVPADGSPSRDPLGPRPDDPDRARAWDLAHLAIAELDRSRGLARDLDQGLSR